MCTRLLSINISSYWIVFGIYLIASVAMSTAIHIRTGAAVTVWNQSFVSSQALLLSAQWINCALHELNPIYTIIDIAIIATAYITTKEEKIWFGQLYCHRPLSLKIQVIYPWRLQFFLYEIWKLHSLLKWFKCGSSLFFWMITKSSTNNKVVKHALPGHNCIAGLGT